MDKEYKVELDESLLCIGLFGDLYTKYAISTPAYFGDGKRPEVVGKEFFLKSFHKIFLFLIRNLIKIKFNNLI